MDNVKFDILINASPAQKALMDFAKTVTKVVSKVESQLKGINKITDSLNSKSMGGFNKGIDRTNKKLSLVQRNLKKVSQAGKKANRFISGAMGLVGGYAAFGGMSAIGSLFGSGSEFQSTMSRVQGITNAGAKDFENLRNKVLEAGKASSFTSSEMALGAKKLAMSGMSSQDIARLMPDVANLGMASGTGVEKTGDIFTNMMGMFGISTKQGTAVADVITSTANSANVSVIQLSKSLEYAGGVAASSGIGFKELNAMIGTLGQLGQHGSKPDQSIYP